MIKNHCPVIHDNTGRQVSNLYLQGLGEALRQPCSVISVIWENCLFVNILKNSKDLQGTDRSM